jgi:hypothetical protein
MTRKIRSPWSLPMDDPPVRKFKCCGTTCPPTLPITDPADACGFTAGGAPQSETWPPDLVETNVINVTNVLALKPYFGTSVPPTSSRYDLGPSGSINISDTLALHAFFGQSCTP